MRCILSVVLMLAACGAAAADTVVVVNNVTSAQQDAEHMARTGILRHCGRSGGRREGIGFSTISADHALRSCCYYGRYRIAESGVARGPRGWFAVIRYGN